MFAEALSRGLGRVHMGDISTGDELIAIDQGTVSRERIIVENASLFPTARSGDGTLQGRWRPKEGSLS